MNTMQKFGIACAALVAAIAVGGLSAPETSETATPSPSPSPSPSTSPSPMLEAPVRARPASCLKVPNVKMEQIADGSIGSGVITPIEAYAVKAADRDQAYFIAMTFESHGVTATGVWMSTSLRSGDVVLAVDALADGLTGFPNAARVLEETGLDETDPYARKAVSCLA
jgi:hypothetical protein